jgi:hypothetical protein
MRDPRPDPEADLSLSLVRGDPLLRAERAMRLLPSEGLGVVRRALALALFAWLPLAAWALWRGRVLPGLVDEPLLQHFGVQARCLVAIPLFVVAEGAVHGATTRLLPHFVHSGLVGPAARERFRDVLRGIAGLRDAALPWLVIAGVSLVWGALAPPPKTTHELIWAADPVSHGFGFGGFWFRWVIRPLFALLLLASLWRVVLLFVLSLRLSRLDLSLVPTHADGAGGLGFVEDFALAFSPVILAMSAVIASRLAHDVRYHGLDVDSLYLPMIVFGATVLVLFLAPLLPWAVPLRAAKGEAKLAYGALLARYGRDVHRRWILGKPVAEQDLLGASEIGAVADTISLYEAVRRMRPAPVGRRALAAILLPAALPMLAVLALEVPVTDLLLRLLKALL